MKYLSTKSKIIVILGPTASGKSDLGVSLAKKYNGEIVSADSRQVYRGMNIGTGKIAKREMQGIPHYLLDVASPKKVFTVSDYQRLGTRAIQKILAKHKLPIIVGGTGFYIDALLYGYALPEVPPNQALRKRFDKLTAEHLWKMLLKLDPRRAKTIDRHNKRRLIRAIEIVLTTKRPVPSEKEILARKSPYDILKLGIAAPRETLRVKIHARLLRRMRAGMLREIERLHKAGVSWKRMDELGLEYRYLSRYLRGLITKEEMLRQLEREIYRYAKRQMTWWRRDKEIRWITDARKAEKLARTFLKKTR